MTKSQLSPKAEEIYIERIGSFSPKLIVLAGFMRIVSEKFIHAFDGRIINLHPSLLPSFKGSNAIEQAFKAGVKVTGCTIHWVTSTLDGGPIIDQREVRIKDGDNFELLETKMHIAEHLLLSDVVARFSKGKISQP